MSVLYRVALLVLLVLQGSNAEECDDLTKRLPDSEVDQILGKWVLVGAVADVPHGGALLVNLCSAHIDLHLNPDNKTISFTERIMVKSKSCSSFSANMTVNSTDPNLSLRAESFYMEENGTVSQLDLLAKGDVYHSSPDCLIVMWDIMLFGNQARFLLSCKRDGKHQGEEVLKAAEEHHRKLAACLHLPDEGHFIYDGVAEFCPEKKDEDQTKDQETLANHDQVKGLIVESVATAD